MRLVCVSTIYHCLFFMPSVYLFVLCYLISSPKVVLILSLCDSELPSYAYYLIPYFKAFPPNLEKQRKKQSCELLEVMWNLKKISCSNVMQIHTHILFVVLKKC